MKESKKVVRQTIEEALLKAILKFDLLIRVKENSKAD